MPVSFQILLSMWTALAPHPGLMASDQMQPPDVVHRCEVCLEAACAHCGAPMSSMESLRSHIVQGDLANHLMTSHSRLWQIAMAYHRLDPAPFMPVRQMLSTACLMCGHAQEPGLICRHFFEAHGMKTGLLHGAPILCVQIERMIDSNPDQIEKCSCAIDLDHETMLPIFSHAGTQCELISYIPVAAAAHLGIDGAGHYQALLKIQPTVVTETSPVKWLVTQDNKSPQACWTVPTEISQNLTLIWMVRTDCLQLPPYTDLPMEPPATDAHDVGDLLALLSKSVDATSSGSKAPSDTLQ